MYYLFQSLGWKMGLASFEPPMFQKKSLNISAQALSGWKMGLEPTTS